MTAATGTINGTLDDLFSVIRVQGRDARDFLHTQLTCEVRQLSRETALVGAYLSPKGRVLGLLTLVEDGDDVLMLTHPSLVSSLVARLGMFVLRSKVVIEPAPDLCVTGHIDPTADGSDASWASLPARREGETARLDWPGGGALSVGPSPADNGESISDHWLGRDCVLGLPHVTDETADRHVAQMLNLDRLGAVNFKKGCFPGQEIVARAHYRGQIKRRLNRYLAAGPLPATTRLEYAGGGGLAGEVVYSAPLATPSGHPVLAVVRVERSAEELVAPERDNARLAPLATEEPNVV